MVPIKQFDPELVLKALAAEETYKSVRNRLGAHILECYGLEEGQPVRLRSQEGTFTVIRASVGFVPKKTGPEMVVRIACRPRGKTLDHYTFPQDVETL